MKDEKNILYVSIFKNGIWKHNVKSLCEGSSKGPQVIVHICSLRVLKERLEVLEERVWRESWDSLSTEALEGDSGEKKNPGTFSWSPWLALILREF